MNDITALMQRLELAAAKDCCHTLLPDDCRALVEALEKAQSANTAQDDHINQQQDQIDTLEKRNAELGREVIHLQSLKTVNAARQEAESEFHRGYSCGHKDASLESRTVTVKLPDVEKWRSPEAVRAQNAYRVLAVRELLAAGIITKVGE